MKALSIILLFAIYGCKANFGESLKVKIDAVQQFGVDGLFKGGAIAFVCVFVFGLAYTSYLDRKEKDNERRLHI
jgi:hypothetical protein